MDGPAEKLAKSVKLKALDNNKDIPSSTELLADLNEFVEEGDSVDDSPGPLYNSKESPDRPRVPRTRMPTLSRADEDSYNESSDQPLSDSDDEEVARLTVRRRSTRNKRRRQQYMHRDDDDSLSDADENNQSSVSMPPRPRSALQTLAFLNDPELAGELDLNLDENTGEFISAEPRSDGREHNPVLRRSSKAHSKTMDALLGQAALLAARGSTDEAVALLHEVIRQDPRKPFAYRQIAEICESKEEYVKCFEYRLLSCHVDRSASADDWEQVGDLAVNLHRLSEAAACYHKATRAGPENWLYFEKRIAVLDTLGMQALAMKTKLSAIETISLEVSGVTFEWLNDLMMEVAEYFVELDDVDRSLKASSICAVRRYSQGIPVMKHLVPLVGTLIQRERWAEACHLILGLCDGIMGFTVDGDEAYEKQYTQSSVLILPFPLVDVSRFVVTNDVPTSIIGRLILSLINAKCCSSVNSLINEWVSREIDKDVEELYLDIGSAFDAAQDNCAGLQYAEKMVQSLIFKNYATSWYLYGFFLEKIRGPEDALQAYEHVLELQINHVDARINMSWILQSMGKIDEALNVLKDVNLDGCRRLPDERLLIRQADVFSSQGKRSEYIRTLRMLLIPHFYSVYLNMDAILKKRRTPNNKLVHVNLRRAMINAISRTPLEKMVNRLGAIAERENRSFDSLSAEQLHDYSMRLIEGLAEQDQFQELLPVVCYSFLHPKVTPTNIETYQNILFYASVKAENFGLAFEYLRYLHIVTSSPEVTDEFKSRRIRQIFLAMNFIFCHQQTVAYQRYIFRCLQKSTDNPILRIISGNNSLMSGSYKNAIAEYSFALREFPNDPLINLNISLCFTHLASRKDITKRAALANRAVAFMARYKELRLKSGPAQEVYYNVGRMLQQLGMNSYAFYWYNRVLEEKELQVLVDEKETGDSVLLKEPIYDLKAITALNLIQMVKTSNPGYARELRRKYCVI